MPIRPVKLNLEAPLDGIRKSFAWVTSEARKLDETKISPTIDADSSPIKAKMDEARRELARLKAERATVKLDADDRDAKVKVLTLDRQIASLSRQVARPKVTLEGADRTLLGLAKVDLALHKLGDTGKQGPISKVTSGFNSLVGSMGQVASVGGTFLNPITIGIGALIAIMSGPLIAALLPITAGFVTFGFVAFREVSKVFKAMQSGKKAIDALPPPLRALVAPLKDVQKQFGGLEKALEPTVAKAFGAALKVISQLMPALKPLAIAAGQAFAAFLGNISDWLKSSSGKKFISWLKTEGPHDIKVFGQFCWTMAQLVGKAFTFLRNAGNTWWKNFKDLIGLFVDAWKHTVRFITVDVPAGFAIFRDKVRIIFDQFEEHVLHVLLAITTAFGHLPGPLGAPFRKASADIRGQLDRIQGDVARTVANIDHQLDRIHGVHRTVALDLKLPKGVTLGHAAHIGNFAKGTTGAAPGWAWVGEEGPELVRMKGGETVLPHHVSRNVAGVPTGYATGAVSLGDRVPSRGSISNIGVFQRVIDSLMRGVAGAAHGLSRFEHFAQSLFTGGTLDSGVRSASVIRAQAFARSMLSAYGWGPSQFPPLVSLWNRESGWNAYAVNPSSGAAGIPQALGHGHPFNLGDYISQIRWGLAYIFSRYGSPAAAWGHEVAAGWYGHGLPTTLFKKPTLIGVGDSPGGEYVTAIPAHSATSGGSVTVNVYAHPTNRPDEVALEIMKVLDRYSHRHGQKSVFTSLR